MSKTGKLYQPHLSTLQDRRAVRTREALRSALLELLETTPLEQVTIRDIAARAGIGYATFFRHHPTKESLLDDLAAEEIERLVQLALPLMDNRDTLAASRALCSYVDQHRTLWSKLLTGGAAATLRQQFLRISSAVAAARAEADGWLPSDLGVVLVVGGTLELLSWWLRQADPMPVERIAEIHARVVVAPVIQAAAAGTAAAAKPRR